VASDSAFTTIFTSGTATTNSFAITGLGNLTNYFWRVKPKNSSCEGLFGAAFQFTTGNEICNTTASTNIPITIGTTANITVNSTLTIPDVLTITDVDVILNITHSWVNDLTITLISPTGTQVRLVARPCANSALNNVEATFDDAGVALVCGNNPAISGVVSPTQLLSALNGQSSNGLWTLRVLDSANQDGGAINSWSLKICGIQPALNINDNIISNLEVYPNPSNGNFSVQFDALSSMPIALDVFDASGRMVYAKTYQNKGVFNENIQLQNLQAGVYFLRIKDGEKQATKKIVIE